MSLEHQVISRLQVTKVTMQELSQKQISNPSKSDKRHSLDFKQEGQTISLLLHLICLQKRFSDMGMNNICFLAKGISDEDVDNLPQS